MEGLYQWQKAQLETAMAAAPYPLQEKVIGQHKWALEELARKSSIANTTTPFNDDENDGDLGLSNPYSRITCFVLYLHSLEYGQPSLAQDLSRVGRTKDET